MISSLLYYYTELIFVFMQELRFGSPPGQPLTSPSLFLFRFSMLSRANNKQAKNVSLSKYLQPAVQILSSRSSEEFMKSNYVTDYKI